MLLSPLSAAGARRAPLATDRKAGPPPVRPGAGTATKDSPGLKRLFSRTATVVTGAEADSARAPFTLDETRSPVGQVLQLLGIANQHTRDAATVSAVVDQLTALQRRHHEFLQSAHVLPAVAGLGHGAMPPTSREAVETLGAQIVRLGSEANYPWKECAEALLELARSVPPRLPMAQRINVSLALRRTFDALAEAGQGEFTVAELSACKGKVSELPQLALDD